MKINDNNQQVLSQGFSNFEKSNVYYNQYDSSYKCGFNKNIISVRENRIEFSSFINIKHYIEMENNNIE